MNEEELKNALAKQYSDTVIDHGMHPRNFFDLEQPDGYAKIKGSCGDTMEFFLIIKKGEVVKISFLTDGCITSLAAGSMTVEMAAGEAISTLRRVSKDDILDRLEGLPADSEHCAQLAADTLHAAIDEYLSLGRDSWKRYYK